MMKSLSGNMGPFLGKKLGNWAGTGILGKLGLPGGF
jgi:hypothetical protein